MGEKEIKPAATGGLVTSTPAAGGAAAPPPRTQERPDTGPKPPPQSTPQPRNRAGGGSGSGSWSGSYLYEDGYRMGRDESGQFHLDNPDGSKATWDAANERWTGPEGNPMPDDWAGGHRPTKRETGPSGGA